MSRTGTRRTRVGKALRVVALVIAACAALSPVLWTALTSLKTNREAQSYPPTLLPERPIWSNYTDLITSGAFLNSLGTSAVVTLLATLLTMAAAFPCAYALVRLRPRGRPLLVLLIVLAQAVPGIVFLIPLYSVVAAAGLYDTTLLLVITYAAFLTPFATLVLASFIRSVPMEIEEAAMVDGCNRLSLLLRIVLPVSRAGLSSAMVFTALFAWNEFLIPIIMSGRNTRTLTVHVSTFVGQQNIEWGPLCAAVMIVLIPAVAVVLFLQRHLVAGLTAGSIK
ncbi:carbohydrate ABC transporter permease [Microbacterium lushaniae]|uniref:Carbohydrate ABC transporter permease n=1 Tax=Microbacterium lushaniae TaxID=2614639 RepID=A0A5J6L7M0_9MICO|nr:carbohydrate ABC transporter permease [Microbacterium lushaniae]QEW04322.1 carbohydrate ABC transporter permease [Microbacterium lushaniae]